MNATVLLPFVPVPALLAFALLELIPIRLARKVVVAVGVGSPLLSALLLVPIALGCVAGACMPATVVTFMTLEVGGRISAELTLTEDPLSVLAAATAAGAGTIVLVFASAYMARERNRDLRRFMALMNQFLAGMLTVVLAGDAVVLFLGWELMSLCSFFLIAYYTESPKAVSAGCKAFVMARIADAMLLAGLLLLIVLAGGSRFDQMIAAAPGLDPWRLGPAVALVAAGALGKSAQIPFHTWLPRAMTGPTPVSALLHSATMVGGGVILLARVAPLLALAPWVAAGVALVGLVTALSAAVSAIIQEDVKRILAYSTISQIGFMMLALGVGAPDAALVHFAAHAAFKSLLFLSAGSMSRAAGGSTALAALRGSRRRQPFAFWTFVAGACSLAGMPLVTAGWFSKEAVLTAVWQSGPWGTTLWAIAATAAVLTGTYAFRVVITAAAPDHGDEPRPVGGAAVWLPLLVLAILALAGGAAIEGLRHFVGGGAREAPPLAVLLAAAAPIVGAMLALAITREPRLVERLRSLLPLHGAGLMDALYYIVFVRRFRQLSRGLAGGGTGSARPEGDWLGRQQLALSAALFRLIARPVAPDHLDQGWMQGARIIRGGGELSRLLQTGRPRDYALGLVLGLLALLLLAWGHV
jgi:NADH-quinone oxidoreductase subunit L